MANMRGAPQTVGQPDFETVDAEIMPHMAKKWRLKF